ERYKFAISRYLPGKGQSISTKCLKTKRVNHGFAILPGNASREMRQKKFGTQSRIPPGPTWAPEP
ncbi:MAG: hypothetical protein AB3K77_15525, partial [Methanosarcinaceae archaeon]